jgi:hypothetical protein
MHTALNDLKLERLFVVHPGKDSYEMKDQMEAVAITHLRARLSQLGMGGEQTGSGGASPQRGPC